LKPVTISTRFASTNKTETEAELFKNLLVDVQKNELSDRLKSIASSLKTEEDLKHLLDKVAMYSKQSEQKSTKLKKPVRVAVTGAAGNIGYALIPRIAR
jgi:FlaA1/EpsC-like NDP-sugar epimerase